MKTIEEIKIELTLKMLSGKFVAWSAMYGLPVNDELRTFVCSLSPICAYWYAVGIDKCSNPETRKAAYQDPNCRTLYLNRFGHFDSL